jgi:Protein of unknown function (DUF3800)
MIAIVAGDQAIRVMSVVCVKADALRVCAGAGTVEAANERCYRDMFHDAIERFEYFLTTGENAQGAYGLVVIDQKSRQFDAALRGVASDLLARGTSYAQIQHVIDGVMVTPSQHSVGLQVADFVAGAIHRLVEYADDRYWQIMRRNVHTDWHSDPLGAGVKRYPTRPGYGSGPLVLPEPADVVVAITVDPLRGRGAR